MPAAREPSLADPPPKRPDVIATGISARTTTFLLVVLTAAAAWLRLLHLGSKSLWLDEGATVALARASWQHFAWVWWHGEANLQTIYFLLLRAWIHLGDSEAVLRLPSALFGIASVPLMYVVACQFMKAGPALATAALLAFSPTHVYYSQEARSYTLTIFLVLLSSYFFVRAVENCRRSDWSRWMIVSILVFYSHDFAALVLVAQACSLLFKQKPIPWRSLTIRSTIIFLAALPGLTYIFRASPENLHFAWMPKASPAELWHLAMFFGGAGLKVAIALVLWGAGVIAIVRVRRNAADPNAFWRGMLVALWAALPVAITALVSLIHPIFLQRYMIFSLPATLLLAGVGVTVLRRWYAGLILVIALCAMSLPTIVEEYSKPRDDWRSASDTILSSASPGDAVVFFPFYTRVMLDYYSDRYPVPPPVLHVFAPQYYAGGEDIHNLVQALDKNPRRFHRVWVVFYGADAQPGNFEFGSTAIDKLQSIFGAPEERKFTNIQVLAYGR